MLQSGEGCFEGCLKGKARVLNENAITMYQLELGMGMLRSKTCPSHSLWECCESICLRYWPFPESKLDNLASGWQNEPVLEWWTQFQGVRQGTYSWGGLGLGPVEQNNIICSSSTKFDFEMLKFWLSPTTSLAVCHTSTQKGDHVHIPICSQACFF